MFVVVFFLAVSHNNSLLPSLFITPLISKNTSFASLLPNNTSSIFLYIFICVFSFILITFFFFSRIFYLYNVFHIASNSVLCYLYGFTRPHLNLRSNMFGIVIPNTLDKSFTALILLYLSSSNFSIW